MRSLFRALSRWSYLLLIISSYFYYCPAYAREVINEFESRVVINLDASADITETINVTSEQKWIRHGIYRYFLQNYKDREGKPSWLRYHFHNVYKDRLPTAYHSAYDDDGALILYIGDKNTIIPPGDYSYILQYHVDKAVSFLKDFDEFYWNITGNHWDFSITHFDIYITLPPGTNITNYLAFTGLYGQQGNNYSVLQLAPNEIFIESTRRLAAHEGVTVAIDWPKGYIKEKNYIENFLRGGNLIGLEVLLFLLVYYIAVFYWESREPASGSIIPLFAPPANLTPAAMRYVSNMEFDDKTFTTAIISIASKGYLRIEQNGRKYTVKKISSDVSKLAPEEVELVKCLFLTSPDVELNSANHSEIMKAKDALKDSLKKECQKIYFNTHAGYVVPATLLSLLGLIAVGLQVMSDPGEVISSLCFGVFVWAYALRFYTMIQLKNFSHVLFVLVLIPTVIFFCIPYLKNFTAAELTVFISLIAINIIFFHLLKAHTADGRILMDKIEGFKMYLSTTETDRFNKLNPPEATPALFEKYFPYALALDVENAWSLKFSAVLAQSALVGSQGYQPYWYSGSNWNTANSTAFTSGLNSGFTSAVSTSSGGGFSGGGGGGGGGGGW